MVEEKLKHLQRFVQDSVDTAWQFNMATSRYDTMPKTFGSHLEFILNSRSQELSSILDEIAQEQLKQQGQVQDPPDFSKYIRYSSSYLDHKEVFVGTKWVLVPAGACVDFRPTTMGTGANTKAAFKVQIRSGSDYAEFTSTESLQNYNNNQQLLNGQSLDVRLQSDMITQVEFDWMRAARVAYQTGENNITTLDDLATGYQAIPKEFKRTYAYKISKVTKAVGKPAKAGKIFQGAEKFAKVGKKLGPIGNILTAGNIAYEVKTDTWDAHTVVDGTLLVVGIAAVSLGAPVVVIGIAIYGILDYAFDISEGLDKTFGRDSGFWDNKPVNSFARDSKPLFNKVKIDNTYVEPRFKIPRKLLD